MQQILKDYQAIYQTEAIGKLKRKKQHQSVIEWLGKEYSEIPDMQEVLCFIRENQNIPFTKHFYDRLVFTQIRLSKDQYDVDALLMVFQKKVVDQYEEFLRYDISIQELENIVLTKYRGNKDILNYRYRRQLKWFDYSVHEVPTGVLCGVNGAAIEDICEMKKDLLEFEKLSISMNIDNREKIRSISVIYDAYEQYLIKRNLYRNFQHYLEMNSIQY